MYTPAYLSYYIIVGCNGLGAKSEKLRFAASPRKGNSIDIMNVLGICIHMEPGKPCCTKLSVVSFSKLACKVRYCIKKSKNMKK